MVSEQRLLVLIVMGSIIAFAVIHAGVSIGIIVPSRQYGSIFQPQIGLSSFNLVIAILGFVTGFLGLICVVLKNDRFNKAIAILLSALIIFSLASLISALVVNDKSLDYVSGRFRSYMQKYQSNTDARNVVDLIQTKKQCCGEDIWLDWARVQLNATSTAPSNSSMVTTSVSSTTTSRITIINSSTSISTSTSSVDSTSTSTSSVGSTSTSTSTNSDNNSTIKRAANPSPPQSANSTQAGTKTVTQNDVNKSDLPAQNASTLLPVIRQKRQIQETYGGINNLPVSFGVTLPGSCCTTEAALIVSGSRSYCLSNYNNVSNHFLTKGCSKSLDYTAGNQAMGFIVINSFMIVLALIALAFVIIPPAS